MNDNSLIFLDYASTTPVDPRVIDAMMPFFNQNYGNSSSVHRFGQQAEFALEQSRRSVSAILGAKEKEVVFTSCGSESDNLALRGVAFARRQQKSAAHIIISAVEHHAVSQTAYQLSSLHGFEIEILPVDKFGIVDPRDVKERIRNDTAIVSVIYANNEIGSINPLKEIGEICRTWGVPFHTDAVQAAAHLPVAVDELEVDLMSIGAHKFYGPKGVGALYIREGTPILPIQTGGGQEFNLRAGTHNIPYIVGLAKAFEFAQTDQEYRNNHYSTIRDHLIKTIIDSVPYTELTGHPTMRLPNHASFVFKGVDGNTLLMLLDAAGFECSSGSACKTGSPEPSEVLIAMGISPEWALGSLRVTLGQQTSSEMVDDFVENLPNIVQRARELNPI
ncbi:MAG: cysteine desulfurase family protein [Anaerolineales bacterium]